MKRFLSIIMFLLFACSAYGQVNLEVSVVNKTNGNPIPGLSIQLKNASIGYGKLTTSNKQGKAYFNGLTTSGSYTVTSKETDKFYQIEASDIVFRSNKDQSVTLVVTPKTTKKLQGVTVRASNSIARINTIDAEVSSELQLQEVKNLPIRSRDFQNALFRLPHVVKSTGGFITAPKVSIDDGNPNYVNYLIDGLDNNENDVGGPKFPIPTGFIQNISVLSSNYSAEFGQSINGIINVTTKSGGNHFTGESYFTSRPGPVIDASSNFLGADFSGVGFQRYQGGFDFGGPIVKDKTFFYVDAEGTINIKTDALNVPQLNVSRSLRGFDHVGLFSAKIDQYWTDNFHSSLRSNLGIRNLDRQGGGLSGGGIFFPSAAYEEIRKSFILANKNTYHSSAFSSTTSFQYSHFFWNFDRPLNPGNNPDVTVLSPQGLGIAHIGAPGFPFLEKENTGEVKQKFLFSLGNHQIKTGGGVITSNFSLVGGGNPNGSYIVSLNQQQLNNLAQSNANNNIKLNDIPSDVRVNNYSVNLRSSPFGRTQNRYDIYAEDLWSVNNKLNITYGLRYDYDNQSKGGGTTGDLNNFGPRFSFNYKLSNKSVLRGGYGRYFQKIPYTITSDALEFGRNSADFRLQIQQLIDAGALPKDTDFSKVLFNGPVSANVPGVTYLQGPGSEQLQGQRGGIFTNTARILNPNGYDNPSSDQFTLGYQRQLKRDISFSVDVLYHRSRDLFVLRELNAPSTPANFPLNSSFIPGPGKQRQVRSPREADAARTVPILYTKDGRPFALINGERRFGVSRGISEGTNDGQSDYVSATFGIKKNRGDDNFSYKLYYTLSYDNTNTEGFNFRAQNNNDFSKEFGPSFNDRPQELEGFFTYYPFRGLDITTTTQIQSGQPINRVPDASNYFYLDSNGNKVNTTDLNGNGIGRSFAGDNFNPILDRVPGASRNSDRLPFAVTFDLSAKYKLPLGGSKKLEFRADVFNVLNTENLSGFQNDGNPTNQIQVGPASSGRFVQRAASPPRQFQFSLSYLF